MGNIGRVPKLFNGSCKLRLNHNNLVKRVLVHHESLQFSSHLFKILIGPEFGDYGIYSSLRSYSMLSIKYKFQASHIPLFEKPKKIVKEKSMIQTQEAVIEINSLKLTFFTSTFLVTELSTLLKNFKKNFMAQNNHRHSNYIKRVGAEII